LYYRREKEMNNNNGEVNTSKKLMELSYNKEYYIMNLSTPGGQSEVLSMYKRAHVIYKDKTITEFSFPPPNRSPVLIECDDAGEIKHTISSMRVYYDKEAATKGVIQKRIELYQNKAEDYRYKIDTINSEINKLMKYI